jgi:hypothetical protein
MTPEQIKKEVIAFLKERNEMEKKGFPMCYVEDGIQFHCNSCIGTYHSLKKLHPDLYE